MTQIETVIEGEMDDKTWDFNNWLNENGLQKIKQVFVDHNMTTLSSLTMQHANFGALMYDERVVTNPNLLYLPKIMSAMASLNAIHDKQKEKGKSKLVFVTNEENEILLQMKQYLVDTKQLKDEIKHIQTSYSNKNTENSDLIQQYQRKCNDNLDKMTADISKTFNNLKQVLIAKENKLKQKINEYRNEIMKISIDNEQNIKKMDLTLKETHSIINDDEKYFQQKIIFVKDVIRSHGNNDNNDYDFDVKNEERENSIKQIGIEIKEYYDTRKKLANTKKKSIVKFNENDIIFHNITEQLHFANINSTIYDNIVNNIDMCITVRCEKGSIQSSEEIISLKNNNILPMVTNIKIESTKVDTAAVKWETRAMYMKIQCINENMDEKETQTKSKVIPFGDRMMDDHPQICSYVMTGLKENHTYNLVVDVYQDDTEQYKFQYFPINFVFFTSRSAADCDTLIVHENETKILDSSYEYKFKKVIVKPHGTLTVVGWDPERKVGGTLLVNSLSHFIVMKNGKIDLSGVGYHGGKSCYSGESYNQPSVRQGKHNLGGGGGGGHGCYGGGGGYGTPGKSNTYPSRTFVNGGESYGDEKLTILHLGSGGGGLGTAGNGGGALKIQCVYFENHGKIVVNGNSSRGDGCGSGGSIFIKCENFVMNSNDTKNNLILACGGNNQRTCYSGDGGDGGDGRIRINVKDVSMVTEFVNTKQIKPVPYIG